jgi:hypothetical protein
MDLKGDKMKIKVGSHYLGEEYPGCLIYTCVAEIKHSNYTEFTMRGPNPYGYDSIGDHGVNEEGEALPGTGGVDVVKELTEFEAARMRKRLKEMVR